MLGFLDGMELYMHHMGRRLYSLQRRLGRGGWMGWSRRCSGLSGLVLVCSRLVLVFGK